MQISPGDIFGVNYLKPPKRRPFVPSVDLVIYTLKSNSKSLFDSRQKTLRSLHITNIAVMTKASYLMMAVFVGSLAAIVYIQRERIDYNRLWSVLIQRGAETQDQNTAQLEQTECQSRDSQDTCRDSSLSNSLSCGDASNNANEPRSSKDNNLDSACFEQEGTATSSKEQQIKEQNRNRACGEEKKAITEGNESLPGHMKKLGEHGSSIVEGEIEELNFVPNGRDFYEYFLRQRKPLVMRGAIKNWPAVQHWANESYLREKYGDVVFDVQLTKKYEGEFPAKKTMNLNEFLSIYKSKQVYLDCPFPHSTMIQDIFVPYCLQCEEIMPTIASTHLLFSSGNTSSSCHMDGYENLLSLIAGTKEILVANPKYVEYFYPRNHTTVNIESPIDPEAVDLKKFPKLAEIPFYKVSQLFLKIQIKQSKAIHVPFSGEKKTAILRNYRES